MVPNSYCGRDRIKAWMVYFIRHSWCFVFEIYLLQYNTTWTFQKIGLFVIRLITSRQLTLPRPQYEIAIWQHLFGTTEIYVIKLILLINHKQFSINLLFVQYKEIRSNYLCKYCNEWGRHILSTTWSQYAGRRGEREKRLTRIQSNISNGVRVRRRRNFCSPQYKLS